MNLGAPELLIMLMVLIVPVAIIALVVVLARGKNSGSQNSGAGAPGWFGDPAGRYERRFWDGQAWTAQVQSAGRTETDELWG